VAGEHRPRVDDPSPFELILAAGFVDMTAGNEVGLLVLDEDAESVAADMLARAELVALGPVRRSVWDEDLQRPP
jgi:hypothetical protein